MTNSTVAIPYSKPVVDLPSAVAMAIGAVRAVEVQPGLHFLRFRGTRMVEYIGLDEMDDSTVRVYGTESHRAVLIDMNEHIMVQYMQSSLNDEIRELLDTGEEDISICEKCGHPFTMIYATDTTCDKCLEEYRQPSIRNILNQANGNNDAFAYKWISQAVRTVRAVTNMDTLHLLDALNEVRMEMEDWMVDSTEDKRKASEDIVHDGKSRVQLIQEITEYELNEYLVDEEGGDDLINVILEGVVGLKYMSNEHVIEEYQKVQARKAEMQ